MMERVGRATASAAGLSDSLVSIQILRAIAALAVLGMHTVAPSFMIGAAGVDLFFVISGFIMVYTSGQLFGRPHAPRFFFLRRVARIVPLYWAVTAIIVAWPLIRGVDLAAVNLSAKAVIASFVFLPYPRLDGSVFPVHPLGWTLNYEMFFYAVFAGAVALPRRRAVLAVIALFVALVALGGAIEPLPQPIAFWSDPIILEFCFGMIIALAFHDGVRLPWFAAVGLIGGAAAWYLASALWGGGGPSMRVVEWGVPAAALVAGAVLSEESPSVGLVGRIFAFLGDASYSIYLVHFVVVLAFGRASLRWGESTAPWLYSASLFATSMMAAILVFLVFEKPTRRWLQGRIRGFQSRIADQRYGTEKAYPRQDRLPTMETNSNNSLSSRPGAEPERTEQYR